MGNWNLNIQGVGPYDTYEFKQAVYDFVNRVAGLQNTVQSATVTFGGQHDFLRNLVTRETAAAQQCCDCNPVAEPEAQ